MVFLIQNTQNRDTAAIQLKLDELIRATQGAHNALLDLEEIDDEQFERYRRSYEKLAAAARQAEEGRARHRFARDQAARAPNTAATARAPPRRGARPAPPARARTARRSADDLLHGEDSR